MSESQVHALGIYSLVVAALALVWLFLWMLHHHNLRSALEGLLASGEQLLRGPCRVSYQGGVRAYGLARTLGALILTDRQVVLIKPGGRAIGIPLATVDRVTDTVTLGHLKHTLGANVVLVLKDGTEVVFTASGARQWRQAIGGLLPSAAGAA